MGLVTVDWWEFFQDFPALTIDQKMRLLADERLDTFVSEDDAAALRAAFDASRSGGPPVTRLEDHAVDGLRVFLREMLSDPLANVPPESAYRSDGIGHLLEITPRLTPNPIPFSDNDRHWFDYGVETITVDPDATESQHPGVMIYTVHDGDVVPGDVAAPLARRLLKHDGDVGPEQWKQLVDHADFRGSYFRERDWGSTLIAYTVAYALGVKEIYRVRLARNIVDFGRLPRVTGPSSHHLARGALHSPISDIITDAATRTKIFQAYDSISAGIEKQIWSRIGLDTQTGDLTDKTPPINNAGLIMLGIHTYDTFDRLREENGPRPDVSLVYRPISLATEQRLSAGVFNTLFPDHLAETTADRALISRIQLALEREYVRMTANYPYCLPDGSVELRAQVYLYFKHLEQLYEKHLASGVNVKRDAVRAFWGAAQNPSSRRLETLRAAAVTQRYPRDKSELDEDIQAVHEDIKKWLLDNEMENPWREGMPQAVWNYRIAPRRASCLAIEVRKDKIAAPEIARSKESGYFWPRDPDHATELNVDLGEVRRIGGLIAQGVREYLHADRPHKEKRYTEIVSGMG